MVVRPRKNNTTIPDLYVWYFDLNVDLNGKPSPLLTVVYGFARDFDSPRLQC